MQTFSLAQHQVKARFLYEDTLHLKTNSRVVNQGVHFVHMKKQVQGPIPNACLSESSRGARWSLNGMTALVTGGTRGIGFSPFSSSLFLSLFILLLLYSHSFFHFKLCYVLGTP